MYNAAPMRSRVLPLASLLIAILPPLACSNTTPTQPGPVAAGAGTAGAQAGAASAASAASAEASSGPAASALIAASASSGAGAGSAPVAAGSAPVAEPAPEGMLLVPGGTFTMGSDDLGEPDEHPAHKVTLKPVWLDTTEVTNEAYRRCVDKGVCRGHDKSSASVNKVGEDRSFRKPKQPISAISWDDSLAYCRWVGKRLPTEAEWEHAARGDDARLYPWGNKLGTHDEAVFGEATTAEVGSRPRGAGPYGHLDLAGNVWEWIGDYYDPYAYRRATAAEGVPGSCDEIMETQRELQRTHKQGFTGSNPIPGLCERVLRGGAFNYHAKGLRASNRVHHAATFRLVMSGFRCAKDVAAAP
jgi:formylglycine-generating enzyme required for sulfatase activity